MVEDIDPARAVEKEGERAELEAERAETEAMGADRETKTGGIMEEVAPSVETVAVVLVVDTRFSRR